VLVGEATLAEAVQVWRQDLSLAILPAGRTPPNPSELLGSARLQDVLTELLSRCDVVIFDSPPLLPVTDAAVLTRATDGALVVARAKSTRVVQVEAAVAALRTADAAVLGLVINRIPRKRGGAAYGYGYGGYHTYGTYAPTMTSPAVPANSREHASGRPGSVPSEPNDFQQSADVESDRLSPATGGAVYSGEGRLPESLGWSPPNDA
jgi:Mrp family chromosome partitioning ATPase